MCGIFAVVGRTLPSASIQKVLDVLRHRGPDGSGTFAEPAVPIAFAHTRLKVIDLETGAQPLESDDGSLVLVCNGEIYDFERIRSALITKGYRFRTKSDSEVILYLYQEYGTALFEHLRGEFAFLLFDRSKNRLIAARDRFGIKPLYFARIPDGIVFASEMKAIFASGLVSAKLSASAFDPLREQDPDHVRLPFEGIEHVTPACWMTVDLATREISTTRYWSAEIPAQVAQPISEPSSVAMQESAAAVLEQLEEAVRLRLRADVPVGLYLSGGVDSAFIGALMRRNLHLPLHSFSISFIGSERDERAFALRSAEVLGTVHHELAVTKAMLWDHLEPCLWHSELPFVTLAPVGKFLLSAEARKTVTVVLTGEGADEVFLGYRGYFRRAIRDTRSARQRGKIASAQSRRLKLDGVTARIVERLSLSIFHDSQRRALATGRALKAAGAKSSKPLINAIQETRIAGMPLDILCFLGDREEMAHSLEARVPFLDHRLYDCAKFISVDLKMRDGLEKAVLRDAAKGVLPDDVRLRRKTGFMLTSDAIDLFGADRASTKALRPFLSKAAFEDAKVFSYRASLVLSALARLPVSKRLTRLSRLRQNANKALMYMMQAHMLHRMFVTDPPWDR